MHPQHAALQHLRRLTRRYPALGRLSVVTTLLTLLWIYVLYWGERTTFRTHIEACEWSTWEKWPAGASPHRLVFVADPQLVDPHTYPGRPWPLSSLTERYTDMYMARNFRLINANLDPDSIVFLGDLLDGGREWATSKARPLTQYERKKLQALGVVGAGKPTWKRGAGDEFGGIDSQTSPEKRSMESYKAALRNHHDHHIEKKDHNLDEHDDDLKTFRYGEDGRWADWGQQQWDAEFERFGRIFFDPQQLYPDHNRSLFVAWDVDVDPVSVENGGRNVTWQEYATSGSKQRRVISSLPGNHDVGYGDGVQWPVRDRFQSRFGESNRIDVIGNHTFVSLDTPSLSAYSQFVRAGGETLPEDRGDMEYIWRPTMEFLAGIRKPAEKAVREALSEWYPDEHPRRGWAHIVTHPHDLGRQPSANELEESAAKPKPQLPVILLSHVPLYRDADTDCGSLREKGRAISISAGYQYQNVLTHELSDLVVQNVAAVGDIVHVFSGDDHDYCDVHHRYNMMKSLTVKNVREITVKSFSWAMGVRRPGFQLVSLWNPVDALGKSIGTPLPTIQSRLCLLPDQLGTFLIYVQLLLFTLVVLLLRAVILGLRPQKANTESDDFTDSPSTRLTLPRSKPKVAANGTANGYATPTRNGSEAKGRQRGSSISTSSNTNSNNSLGVQRSYNARTRSVSPAVSGAVGAFPDRWSGPLVDRAGFYPQVRWQDPADEESDEEERVGSHYEGEEKEDEDDSAAKWKRRKRTPGVVRRVVGVFGRSLVIVGSPAIVWYWWLLRNG